MASANRCTTVVGGHSLRTGGAVLLAAEGVHPYQIELIGRWRSPMLTHYARTAPLKKLSRDYVRNKVHEELHQRLDELAKNIDELRMAEHPPAAVMVHAESLAQDMQGTLRDMVQEEIAVLKRKLLTEPSVYIHKPSSGAWHQALVDGTMHLPTSWKACCGWKFGLSSSTRADTLPQRRKCRRCGRCFADYSSSRGTTMIDRTAHAKGTKMGCALCRAQDWPGRQDALVQRQDAAAGDSYWHLLK